MLLFIQSCGRGSQNDDHSLYKVVDISHKNNTIYCQYLDAPQSRCESKHHSFGSTKSIQSVSQPMGHSAIFEWTREVGQNMLELSRHLIITAREHIVFSSKILTESRVGINLLL